MLHMWKGDALHAMHCLYDRHIPIVQTSICHVCVIGPRVWCDDSELPACGMHGNELSILLWQMSRHLDGRQPRSVRHMIVDLGDCCWMMYCIMSVVCAADNESGEETITTCGGKCTLFKPETGATLYTTNKDDIWLYSDRSRHVLMDYTVFFMVDQMELDALLALPSTANDVQPIDSCLSDIPTSIT